MEDLLKKYEDHCKNLSPSMPKKSYMLKCARPHWFQGLMSCVDNAVFSARDDVEALCKMRKYVLENEKWKGGKYDQEPVDIFKYAMGLGHWGMIVSCCESELNQETSDEENNQDDDDRCGDIYFEAMKAFYGLGGYQCPLDCALTVDICKHID